MSAGRADADVPCGECTACCRSSYFIHIAPDETAALRRIPAALRFPAPGRPKGHVLLGFDEDGRCPMLVDDRCSIYEDRPRTCRSFDCRVFAAAGLDPAEDGKPRIADRVRRWRFDVPTDADAGELAAVRAAAAFLRAHPESFPDGAPGRASDLAAAALAVHRLFLAGATPVPGDLAAALRQ